MKSFSKFLFPGFLFLLLTGCDSTKEFLGLKEKQPDAFEVMDRAPLELPPDFSLRPPEPGKKRPQEKAKRDVAADHLHAHVKGKIPTEPSPSHYKSSHGQKLLLRKAGAQERRTSLRNQMRSQEEQDSQDSFLKQLVSGQQKEAVIDPHKEGLK